MPIEISWSLGICGVGARLRDDRSWNPCWLMGIVQYLLDQGSSAAR